MTTSKFELDPQIVAFEEQVYKTPLIQDVWNDKYLQKGKGEFHPWEAFKRVAKAIANSPVEMRPQEAEELFYDVMVKRLFLPGGRILAGAGTDKHVTLMNCYVNGTLDDSIEGIADGKKRLLVTSSMGGGMGTDFSPLRPHNAVIGRLGSASSGSVSFMDTFNADGKTIRSAGERRAAQMGTIIDTHPDLVEFIKAKGEGLKDGSERLKEFNVSVLISDAFKAAVEDDEEWVLHFHIPPRERDPFLEEQDFYDEDGVKQYVYSVWPARKLWNLITEYTYEFSDPGVIFIDRVNELNNLSYVEKITCTNPCVTGDTLILTKDGWRPITTLIGKEIEVWNGFEWSKTTPFSTGENELIEIAFSNGNIVRCTPYHKWVLSDGRRVEARHINEKDKLLFINMPTLVDGIEYPTDAYSQGMYCGDGTKNSEYSNLYKHNEGILNRLVGKIYNRNCEPQPGTRWIHGKMLPKDFVPVEGSVNYCINWLAGYFDADGCVVKKKDTKTIEASAKDREFLKKIGLMLNRLGINYRIWERADAGLKTGSNGQSYMCESTASLMLSHREVHKLVRHGLNCERLDLSHFKLPPNGVANVGHRVVSIKKLQHKEETYCLNEPLRNMFIANGVITGNCGEQPLPPNGTCNLGAVNVANCVRKPFTDEAAVDYDLIDAVARVGIRFLDNVIDVTNYPLPEQREEELNKRRVGLGILGLGTLFAELGIKYGSLQSQTVAAKVMKTIALAAYEESIELAQTRGTFPLYQDEIVECGFIEAQLPDDIKEKILDKGLRNGVLLTIAPVGTGSIAFCNVSSGLEPDFAHEVERRVRQNNTEEFKKYIEKSYTRRFFEFCTGRPNDSNPEYLVTAEDLTILDHIKVQAALQKWVDASTSKTINIPEDMPYEEFQEVYELAYQYGLKGCTTYRHSKYRQSILRKAGQSQQVPANGSRPESLTGTTYKVKWPSMGSSMFVTINYQDGRPYEIFFASKDAKFADWMTGLTLMVSAILRSGIDPSFIPKELRQVQSTHDTSWHEGKFVGSLVARIAMVIEQDFIKHEIIKPLETLTPTKSAIPVGRLGDICPSCQSPTLFHQEGCKKCSSCGYSSC